MVPSDDKDLTLVALSRAVLWHAGHKALSRGLRSNCYVERLKQFHFKAHRFMCQ